MDYIIFNLWIILMKKLPYQIFIKSRAIRLVGDVNFENESSRLVKYGNNILDRNYKIIKNF